jgi:hypothetical protein
MTTPFAAEAASPCCHGPRSEVWLRGNARPAIGLLLAVLTGAGLAGIAVVALDPPWWAEAAVAGVAATGAAVAAGLVWAARQPRLVRAGDTLEVRLSPFGRERVPLEIVECVFPGSQSLDAADADDADGGRRVNTLVLRLAERATEWRSRPVTAAWGAWDDGNVVFDGRWCEPLSPALAREISARLVDAKREAAPGADA